MYFWLSSVVFLLLAPYLSRMRKALPLLPGYRVVLYCQVRANKYAVLIEHAGRFAACFIQPDRQIASAPNYHAAEHGLLAGPLSAAGLNDLLQWATYDEAERRYRRLAQLPANVVNLLRPPVPVPS